MRAMIPMLSIAALLGACGGPEPLLPEDYESTFVEVRNCRQSGDHDLHMIRVLADPSAVEAYTNRSEPFPAGASIVKEEYDFGDTDCTGPIVQWTVMQKLPSGTARRNLDWEWETVDADRRVVDMDPMRCVACHSACGEPPDGYDATCTLP